MSAVIISEAASAAPNLRHRIRNGRSVTPAIGASTTLPGSLYGPMRGGGFSARIGVIGTGHTTTACGQAGVDLEPDRVCPRVDETHLRIDTLATSKIG